MRYYRYVIEFGIEKGRVEIRLEKELGSVVCGGNGRETRKEGRAELNV